MSWMVALLGGLREAADWLCNHSRPWRLSDREVLGRACPLIWFLLCIAAISTAVFIGK
jgi:hypothetical protein